MRAIALGITVVFLNLVYAQAQIADPVKRKFAPQCSADFDALGKDQGEWPGFLDECSRRMNAAQSSRLPVPEQTARTRTPPAKANSQTPQLVPQPSSTPKITQQLREKCSHGNGYGRLICTDGELTRLDAQLNDALEEAGLYGAPDIKKQSFAARDALRNELENTCGLDKPEQPLEQLTLARPCTLSVLKAKLEEALRLTSTIPKVDPNARKAAIEISMTGLVGEWETGGCSGRELRRIFRIEPNGTVSNVARFPGDASKEISSTVVKFERGKGGAFILSTEGSEPAPATGTRTTKTTYQLDGRSSLRTLDNRDDIGGVFVENEHFSAAAAGGKAVPPMVRCGGPATANTSPTQPSTGEGDQSARVVVTRNNIVSVTACPGCSGQPTKQANFESVNFQFGTLRGIASCTVANSSSGMRDGININPNVEEREYSMFFDDERAQGTLNAIKRAVYQECLKGFQAGQLTNAANGPAKGVTDFFSVSALFNGMYRYLEGYSIGLNAPWIITVNGYKQREQERVALIQAQLQAQRQRQQAVQQLAGHGTTVSGPLSAEVLQCIKGFFPNMGFSAPMVKGNPCSDFMGLYDIKTIDTRDIPNGTEVMTEVTLQITQPIGAQSVLANACYGGTQKDMRPGETVLVNARIQFEKWSSGLRCTSQRW